MTAMTYDYYLSDEQYAPGTVVIFGGDKEVTISNLFADIRLAGVVSTHRVIGIDTHEFELPIANQGRAVCRVIGVVNKGDCLVSSRVKGVAVSLGRSSAQPGCIIGKALQEYNSDHIGTIEIAIWKS